MTLSKLLAKRLTSEEQSKMLAQIRTFVERQCPISRAYVFGSLGRMEMTDASDIDLLVEILDDASRRETRKVLRLLPLEMNYGVDLIVMTQTEFEERRQMGSLPAIALEEGQLIYDGLKI